MKHNFLTRCCAALMLLVLLIGALPLRVLAADSNLYITGYTVTDSAGRPVGAVTKGSQVDITVSVKDTGDGTGQGDPTVLDITKLEDSFQGGAVLVEKTSQENRPLIYSVRFTGLTYKGVGQALRFQIGVAGQPDSYQTMELTITEAVVYEAPPAPTPEPPPAPEPSPVPLVLVSRSELSGPVEAGQEVVLKITFQNLSTIRLKSPVASFTPSEGITLMSGASSFALEDIAGKKSASVTLRLQAAKTIASSSLTLDTELKFNYFNNVSLVQGSASEKIVLPAQPREVIPQPVVIVTRSPLEKPLAPGEEAEVQVTFQNAGVTPLVSPVASVTASDALLIQNDASTFLLGDIPPGKSGSVTVKIRAAKEISSSNQFLSTELKYGYDNGTTLTQAAASDRINITANPAEEEKKPDAPVPNLIIRKFTYGGGSVAAGSKFPLEFTFENTGATKVENVVVTVDGGECFTMDGSTNTFFYKSLASGASQTQAVPMQAVPTGKSGAQTMSVGFKYEYVDKDKRSQGSADIRISIPVYQPDRFQINAPALPETFTVGEESEVILTYVNKGKDDIANVEATVEGDGVDTPARTQYVGNIIAGASGNIGFALTPTEAGEIHLTLKVSYENGNQQVQTREFTVDLRAEEAPVFDDYPMEDFPEEQGSFPWLWVILATAAAAAAVAVFLLRRKKKADSAQDSAGWEDWDREDSGESGGENR